MENSEKTSSSTTATLDSLCPGRIVVHPYYADDQGELHHDGDRPSDHYRSLVEYRRELADLGLMVQIDTKSPRVIHAERGTLCLVTGTDGVDRVGCYLVGIEDEEEDMAAQDAEMDAVLAARRETQYPRVAADAGRTFKGREGKTVYTTHRAPDAFLLAQAAFGLDVVLGCRGPENGGIGRPAVAGYRHVGNVGCNAVLWPVWTKPIDPETNDADAALDAAGL